MKDNSAAAVAAPNLPASETMVELVARAICNAHRRWDGRSERRQQEIVDQAWTAHIAEARAALAAIPSWRPIAEAPKDGTPLLVFIPRRVVPTGKRHADGSPFVKTKIARLMIAHWVDGPPDTPALPAGLRAKGLVALQGGYWTARSDGQRPIHSRPTHWQPLPPPPIADDARLSNERSEGTTNHD